MYDRLGDFLKDALDSGEIPQYEANYFSFENKVEEYDEQKKNSSIFFKLKRNPNPKEERAFSKLECAVSNERLTSSISFNSSSLACSRLSFFLLIITIICFTLNIYRR